MGVMKPIENEWAAPIVFATKRDRSSRICIDYGKLSTITIRGSYFIPRIDECIDPLGYALILFTLDVSRGFWQVKMDDAERDKIDFTSHHGLFRF